MAQLTLRDLATNEEIIVPPEGFVFGRTGGDADIQIEDNSISRRQARVSNRQGTWVLEVMVVPPGQRLPRPQSLQEGQTFFIGQSEFEVLQLADEEEESRTVAPPRKAAPAAAAPAAKRPASAPAAASKSAPPPAKKPAPKPAARPTVPVDDEPEHEDEPVEGGKQGIAALFVGVPKGIAYYLVNVPKLLFNPLGTVRSTIADLPNPPLGRSGLIGYALPSLVATGFIGAWAFGISRLIGGFGFDLMSFIPIPQAIGAVISAVITGFFGHQVLGWVINKLQGESDERSRSNFFLQTYTLAIVLAVPNALGTILGSIRLPFINLLGPLLMTAASLVSIFVFYQWFVFFKVYDWVRKVILVLGALSVIGAAWGLVTGIIANVRSLGSGSSSSSSAASDIEANSKEAEAAADEAMKNMDAAQKEQLMKARALQKTALEAAAKGGKAAQAAQEAALKQAKEAQEAAEKAADRGSDEGTKTATAPAKEAREPKEEKHPPREAPVAESDDGAAAPSSGFGAYAHRRDAIEKRLESDPTVLAGDTELQRLYGNYVEAVYKIDQEYMKKVGKDIEHTKLYDHLKNAELYKKTGSLVDKLSSKLNVK